MKALGKPGDALWTWVVRAFAGSTCGCLVEWDPAPPTHPSAGSQFIAPEGHKPGRIRVRHKDNADAEYYWSLLVFELHNIAYYSEFSSIYKNAYNWRLSSYGFVKEMFTQEYQTAADVRAFYCHIFLPYAIENRHRTTPDYWCLHESLWEDCNSAFAAYTNKSQYPWTYRSEYRRIQLQRLFHIGIETFTNPAGPGSDPLNSHKKQN
jgi:hypothetical protein